MKDSMKDAVELDDFQAALTTLLARRLAPDETARILAEDPTFAPYRAWVTSFLPTLTDTAAMLSEYWARCD